ncbi:heat shock transcription factor, other eukaryote [Cryptococcus neoformans Tu259-1]|uniref:Heat shock transcription factor, other eukaryote n=1 Tax=Cryptococcus neoformans Tu259-1 TaxID=1230072 RepID=A0A854QL50_CRYNE|nr:heat shock transcription factor, other eukaryote [Cryptococcus neoformans var. grubii Tu259-1]
MTTNLYAIAGPSKPTTPTSTPSPRSEPPSPLKSLTSLPTNPLNPQGTSTSNALTNQSSSTGIGISKPGLSVDENGEVMKVPAFLNKLYTMVSDPEVDDLIYWGENGDSFFVPNAELFGRELLPRWFKHSNFSSFVRQLNMYGFHKVPHLQSGALKNETPIELWEFANPYFKRGQPQLLTKVTRKNNRPSNSGVGSSSSLGGSGAGGGMNTRSASAAAASGSGSGQIQQAISQGHEAGNHSTSGKYLITDGTTPGSAPPSHASAGPLIAPQTLDLSAINSGIAAIRQTQASIATDLRKLQASNEALWRQAYETQEKQRKHEETIDLIVSFLERLFGTEGEGLKGLKEAMRRGVGVRRDRDGREGRDSRDARFADDDDGGQKKRRRVGIDRMIEGGSGDGTGEHGEIESPSSDDRLVEIGSNSEYSIPSVKRTSSSSHPLSLGQLGSSRFTALPSEDTSPSGSGLGSTPYEGLRTTQASAHGAGADVNVTDPTLGMNHLSPLSDTDPLLPSSSNALAPYSSHPSFLSSNPNPSSAWASNPSQPLLSPTSAAAAAHAYNLDPSLLQTTIGSLLQSPAAAQMFLNSLSASAQGQALTSHSHPHNPSPLNPNPNGNASTSASASAHGMNTEGVGTGSGTKDLDPTLALFSPLPSHSSLASQSNDLLKSYNDALTVGEGVDNLQESIDSLVRSMGLDLPNGGSSSVGVDVGDGSGVGTGTGEGDGEFNVDEFLQGLAKEGEGEEGEREVGGDGDASSSGAGAENGRKEDVIVQSGLK